MRTRATANRRHPERPEFTRKKSLQNEFRAAAYAATAAMQQFEAYSGAT
jgi:hypothetical protein